MLHLIPKPLHRLLYRIAYRVRGGWRRLTRWPGAGVSVIARDGEGQILLVRHSYGSRRWALPGGGLGRNEDPVACARREMNEELGCQLTDVALFEVVESTIQGASDRSYIFTARLEGEPRPDGREILEARWFSLDALPAQMVSLSRRQLQKLGRS